MDRNNQLSIAFAIPYSKNMNEVKMSHVANIRIASKNSSILTTTYTYL